MKAQNLSLLGRLLLATLAALTCLALLSTSEAQNYTVSTVVDFPARSENGPVTPNGITTMDVKGNLYGTSTQGGTHNKGTVFKVSATGVLTVLHSFNGTDGNFPVVGVVRDSAGNLYGTTENGGPGFGYGVLYEVAPDGTETVLYDFPNKSPQGNYPIFGVTIDPPDDLIGYTSYTSGCCSGDYGSIYTFTQPRTFSVQYSFESGVIGDGPVGTPLRGKAGVYYGAANSGGSSGGGSVFKYSNGTVAEIYSFDPFTDPISLPKGSVVQDKAGNLYGVGVVGGIYEVTASGKEKDFYLAPSGIHPHATLLIDSAGNLYGTNDFGGTYGTGAVFRVSPEGVETDLYSSPSDLADGLVMDRAGNIYGTQWSGGTNGTGAIFKLTKN